MSEVILNGVEVAGGPATSQVYKATHKGDGSRLSFMDRSFISFSFGEKWVEDYGLIVVIDGDRIGRNLYAEFSDNETESDILDEKFFWSSHFNGNNLSLVLSTDGITENQLSEIQRWLKPGNVQELILSEHPNRAIRAHVAPTPSYNLLPFEEKTEVKVGGLSYKTSTTIYRGDISLDFTMEEPYWYAKSNVLCYKEDNDPEDYDSWLSAQDIPAFIYQDPDATKVILEDGTPINAMLKHANMLTGSNIVINEATLPNTQIGTADIDSGRMGPLFVESSGLSMNSGVENAQYFYYGGTAPAKPALQFTLVPIVNNTSGYITSPYNTFVSSTPYNIITIESENKKEFKFTTPSIWTGYNQAIAIITKMNNQPLEDVRRALREGVNHFAARAYAISVACAGDGTARLSSSTAIGKMKKFLQDSNNQIAAATFSINCKTGETIGKFTYRSVTDEIILNWEEEVGDMIRSNYLIIEDRNYPSNDGYIEKWTEENPQYSHRIYHNVENGLSNVLLKYKYMYY